MADNHSDPDCPLEPGAGYGHAGKEGNGQTHDAGRESSKPPSLALAVGSMRKKVTANTAASIANGTMK
jgi:hypothetical protein